VYEDLQTFSCDLTAYEREQSRRKWPAPKEAPFSWLSFLGWSVLRRDKLIGEDVGWPTFDRDLLAEVSSAGGDDEDDEDEAGTPTLPGPDPGSSAR